MVAALLGIASKLGWMAITALAAIVGAKYGPQAAQAVHDAWRGKGESITEEQARQILAAYEENEAEIARNMAETLSFGVGQRERSGDLTFGVNRAVMPGLYNPHHPAYMDEGDVAVGYEYSYADKDEMSIRKSIVETMHGKPPKERCQWLRQRKADIDRIIRRYGGLGNDWYVEENIPAEPAIVFDPSGGMFDAYTYLRVLKALIAVVCGTGFSDPTTGRRGDYVPF